MSVFVDVGCVPNKALCLRVALKKSGGRLEDVFRRSGKKISQNIFMFIWKDLYHVYKVVIIKTNNGHFVFKWIKKCDTNVA